jgi:hypothetical protein
VAVTAPSTGSTLSPNAIYGVCHRLPMKRIFIALAFAFALTGAMLVTTVLGHIG